MAKEATITISLEGLGNIEDMLSGLEGRASNASQAVEQISEDLFESASGSEELGEAMGGATDAILEATGGMGDLPDATEAAEESFEGLNDVIEEFKESFQEVAGPVVEDLVSNFSSLKELVSGEMGEFAGVLDSIGESASGLGGILGNVVEGLTAVTRGFVKVGDVIITTAAVGFTLIKSLALVASKLGIAATASGIFKGILATLGSTIFSVYGLVVGLYLAIRTLGSIAAQTAAIIQGVLLTSIVALPASIAAVTGAVAGLATTVGASMEESFRNVNEILANSNVSLQNFHDMIIQIAADIPETGRTVSKVMRNVLKSGVRAEDQVRALTKSIIDLGRLSDQALSATANQIIKISRAFGLLEGDATENVRAFADDLVTVRDRSVASIDELTSGLRRVAASASLLDVPTDQVLALTAGIQNAGMTARRSGTRMRRMFEEIAKATEDMESQRYFANLIGVRPGEFEDQLQENFIGTVRELGKAIGGSEEQARQFAKTTDQLGTAAATAMAAISSNIDDINDTIDELEHNQGALQNATDEALGTFRKQLAIAADRIYLTGQAFGSVLVEPITKGLTVINKRFEGTMEYISRLRSELEDSGFAENFYTRMYELASIDELFDFDLQGFAQEMNKLRSEFAGPAMGIAQEIGGAILAVFNSTVWPMIKNVSYNIMRETAIIFVQLLIKSLYRLPNVLMEFFWDVIEFFSMGLAEWTERRLNKVSKQLDNMAPQWVADIYDNLRELLRALSTLDFPAFVKYAKEMGIELRASISYAIDYTNKAVSSLLTQLRNRLLGSAGAFVTKIARGLDKLPYIDVEPTVEMSVHTDVGKRLQNLNLEKLGLGIEEATENIYEGAQELFYATNVSGEQLQGADLLNRLKESTDLSEKQIVELYKPMKKLNTALSNFDYEAEQIKNIIKNILSGGTLKMEDMPEYSKYKKKAENEVQNFMKSWFMTQVKTTFDPDIADIIKQSFDRSADTIFEGINLEQLASGLSGRMDRLGEEGKRLLKRGLGDNLYQKLLEAIREANKEMDDAKDIKSGLDQLQAAGKNIQEGIRGWGRIIDEEDLSIQISRIQEKTRSFIEDNTGFLKSLPETFLEGDWFGTGIIQDLEGIIPKIERDISQMSKATKQQIADISAKALGEDVEIKSRKEVKDAKENILTLIDRLIPERKEWEERLNKFAKDMQSDFAQGLSEVVFQDAGWDSVWRSFAQTFSDLVFQQVSEDLFEELGFKQAAKNIGEFVGGIISGFTNTILGEVRGQIVEDAALQKQMKNAGKAIGEFLGGIVSYIVNDIIIQGMVSKIVSSVGGYFGFGGSGIQTMPGGQQSAAFHGGLMKKFRGGLIQAFASGGQVFGESGIDRIPAMLTDGEYVMRRQAVNERTLPLLEQINNNPRNFAQGGRVGGSGSSSKPQDEGRNVVYNISAVDARSFQQLVQENPEAIDMTVQKNIEQNGATRKAIKGLT